MSNLNIQMLLTGDELMSGDVIDSNSSMVAEQLLSLGLLINKKVTIGDNLTCLVDEIHQMTNQADILIVNGGLGPTSDDLTSEAIAQCAGLNLTLHDGALAHLKAWCARRNISLSDANKKQALLPQNCEIIANEHGSAVGIKLTMNNCIVYATPGVPSELTTMFAHEILPELTQHSDNQTQISRMQTFGLGEAKIQQLIHEHLPNWPKDLQLGFRAAMPFVEIKVLYNSKQKSLASHWQAKLTSLFGEHVIAHHNKKPIPLAKLVIDLLSQNNKTICTAESCTGGLIASQITAISGSSSAFEAGYVTYSNSMKTDMLSVPKATLDSYGAVSKQTVEAMLKGALDKSGADIGVAVSGVAGPNGGSQDKPVGSVWLAWGSKEKINSHYFYIPHQRIAFQYSVTARALDLARRLLTESNEIPAYMSDT